MSSKLTKPSRERAVKFHMTVAEFPDGRSGGERLRRHLLYRLWRRARLKAVEKAIDRKLLALFDEESEPEMGRNAGRRIGWPGMDEDTGDDRFYATFDSDSKAGPARRIVAGPTLRGRSRRDAERILARHGIRLPRPDAPTSSTRRRSAASAQDIPSLEELWRAIRRNATPPRADEIAVVLLLAGALDRAEIADEVWRRLLRSLAWIAVVVSAIEGFELRLIRMLKGHRLGRIYEAFDGYDAVTSLDALPSRFEKRRPLILFSGDGADNHDVAERDVKAAYAVRLGHPTLGVAANADLLPQRLRHAADLSLDTGPLTGAIVAAVLREVVGSVPDDCATLLPDEVCAVLSLHDLVAAIRPGVPAGKAVRALRRLAGVGEDVGVPAKAPFSSGARRAASAVGEKGRHGRKILSGNELILPVVPSGGKGAPIAITVETLHGYGAAKDWALDLKNDLALWRQGRLLWTQMSTRLLLSGPPGTGKTTFARALCNTLRIPLAVTSVSTWLEGGHLGDVIKRIRLSFEDAQRHAPAILFVDEIDGIGKRGQGHEYDDYWNTIVNKLLELLDGAIKSEGLVVVGATNHPGVIDPAIRRSGRLETHIEIPLPDVDALVGILAHHLGNDCPNVIATAPQAPPDPASTAATPAASASVTPVPTSSEGQ